MGVSGSGPLAGGGERIDVHGRPHTHTEQDHLRRYQWALPQITGRVLDVACGTGYGSELMSARAEVVGIDNEPLAVEAARSRVRGGSFKVANVPPIPEPDHSFDAVVAFETIEHIDDDLEFVREIRRLLKPSGLLLLSTPNKAVTSPNGPPANRWHVREYLLPDLISTIHRADFLAIDVFCQGASGGGLTHTVAHKLVARFPALCRPDRWWDRLAHGNGEVEPWSGGSVPMFWVLSCR
jgi:SAM-dependent methyltransferase